MKSPHPSRALRFPEFTAFPDPAIEFAFNGPGPNGWTPPESDDVFSLMFRRKTLVGVLVVFGMLAGYAAYRLQPRTYEASTSLEVEPPNDNYLNMSTVNPTLSTGNYPADSYMLTQIEVLHSNTVLSRVVEKMGLARRLNVPTSEEALEIVSANLRPEAAQGSRIINLRYRCNDATLAAEIANAVTDEYVQNNLDARWNGTQRTANWLRGRLDDLKTGLEKSEAELQGYSRNAGLVFTGEKDSVAEEKLRQIQDELLRAQADTMQKQARSELVRHNDTSANSDLLESEVLRSYRARIAELRQQRAEVATLLTPAHYKVKRVDNQIAELESLIDRERTGIAARIQADYDTAKRRQDLLLRAYRSQEASVSVLAGKTIRYNGLKREIDSSRQLYESLLQRVKEAGVAAAIRASNVRIVDPATAPRVAFRPRLAINLSAGAASGLFLGAGLVILIERSNRKLRCPREVSSYLSIRTLGGIPHDHDVLSPTHSTRTLIGRSATPQLELVTWQCKQSLFAESYRQILASILSRAKSEPVKVIVMTSPNPAEGKTTAVCNLGIALARMNRRTLLIDADLRNPRLHQVFKTPQAPGLSDLASSNRPGRDLVHPTDIPGLFVLPAGPLAGASPDLVWSVRMSEVMNDLRQEFDAILLDTPPLLLLADARMLGQLADAAVVVLRAGKTDRVTAHTAVQRLEDDGIPLLGTILTDWRPDQSKFSSYYRYNSEGDRRPV